jgi:hypothetical protein
MCSCDLYCAASNRDAEAKRLERLRRDYSRRGWSPAKIERALEQSAGHHKQLNQAFIALRPDVRQLLEDLSNRVGEVAVVVHWFSGLVEDERFTIKPIPAIESARLSAEEFPLNEDELLLIRRST